MTRGKSFFRERILLNFSADSGNALPSDTSATAGKGEIQVEATKVDAIVDMRSRLFSEAERAVIDDEGEHFVIAGLNPVTPEQHAIATINDVLISLNG
jgi:hypothetical protein